MNKLKKPEPQDQFRGNELAEGIANNILLGQKRIASFLNRKTAVLSRRTKMRILLLFCLLFSALNLYLLIRSITQ